jgi:hypothetical protein
LAIEKAPQPRHVVSIFVLAREGQKPAFAFQ